MKTINLLTKEDVAEMIQSAIERNSKSLILKFEAFVESREIITPTQVLNDSDSVKLLGLYQRTMNVLSRCDITTVGQLYSLKESGLHRYQGIGRGTLKEIDKALKKSGWALGTSG